MFLVILSWGKKVVLPFLSILPGRVDSSGVSSFQNLPCKKLSHQGVSKFIQKQRVEVLNQLETFCLGPWEQLGLVAEFFDLFFEQV